VTLRNPPPFAQSGPASKSRANRFRADVFCYPLAVSPSPGDRLRAGKLPAADLEAMLARLAPRDPRLLVGPRPGEDAAVIDVEGRCIVVATDPITFATDRIGWYAVHVNANDVAVMGGRPAWFLAVLLMPEGCTRDAVREIMDDIQETCAGLGIAVAGGHTEITAGLSRPIVIGQMIGETTPEGLVTKAGLRPGDAILLTRGAAIEGTALLARELPGRLAPSLGEERVAAARRLLFDPGISVLDAVRVATGACRVHAMHDPTEGGVVAGLHEMVSAAGLGVRAWGDRIPVLEETKAVCEALDLDPLALIASGALLVGCAPGDAPALAEAFRAAGISAAVVAEAVPAFEGRRIQRGGRWRPLVPPERDEVARIIGAP
jgi:hydrogenase expression/formation protein HypE